MDSPLNSIRNVPYSKLTENGTQYEKTEFLPNEIIDAKYIHSDLYPGNAMIEALPPMLSETRMILASTIEPDFDHEKVIRMSPAEQSVKIDTLETKLHIYLPMERSLNIEIRAALLKSYGSRTIVKADGEVDSNNNRDNPLASPIFLSGDAAGPSMTGFYMTGTSGCGKSTALESIRKHLPQVLRHTTLEGVFYQIVHLTVTCPSNSDFRGLYKAIGKAIDKALKNGNWHIYEAYLGKPHLALADLNSRLEDLICIFGIGLIIIDEAQNMRFNSAYDNSVNQLLNLSNSTKVAFSFVGTQFFDTNYKFDSDSQKTVRRIGNEVPADQYCSNRKVFQMIVRSFTKYQLFEPEIDFLADEELMEAFYQVTGGSIGAFAKLWIAMNKEYIDRNREAEINIMFMNQSIAKHCSHLFQVISNEEIAKRKTIINAYTKRIMSGKSGSLPETFQETNPNMEQIESIISRVLNRLHETFDGVYTEDMINDAMNKSMDYLGRKKAVVTEDILRKETVSRLQRTANRILKDSRSPYMTAKHNDAVTDYLKQSVAPEPDTSDRN